MNSETRADRKMDTQTHRHTDTHTHTHTRRWPGPNLKKHSVRLLDRGGKVKGACLWVARECEARRNVLNISLHIVQ